MKKLLTMLGAVSLLTSSPMIIVSSTQNTIAEKINLTNIHLQEFNIDTNGMPNDGFTIFVTMLEYISQNFADQGLADFANDVIVHASSDDGWYAFNDDYEKWTIPEPGDIINHKSFMIIANSQNESYSGLLLVNFSLSNTAALLDISEEPGINDIGGVVHEKASKWEEKTAEFKLDMSKYASDEKEFLRRYRDIYISGHSKFYDPENDRVFNDTEYNIKLSVSDILDKTSYIYSTTDIQNGGDSDSKTHDIFWDFQEGGNKDYLGIIYCTHYGYIQNETNGMAYIDTKYNAASQTITFMLVSIYGTFHSGWNQEAVGANVNSSMTLIESEAL
jgi:hypothetical protein